MKKRKNYWLFWQILPEFIWRITIFYWKKGNFSWCTCIIVSVARRFICWTDIKCPVRGAKRLSPNYRFLIWITQICPGRSGLLLPRAWKTRSGSRNSVPHTGCTSTVNGTGNFSTRHRTTSIRLTQKEPSLTSLQPIDRHSKNLSHLLKNWIWSGMRKDRILKRS